MSENNNSVSEKNVYVPNAFTKFLWWLSTAEKELLVDCVVDRNKFKIIGLTVLATWAFATLAWIYFFSTIIENAFLFTGLGVFMGFIILSIDRALIKGISKFTRNSFIPFIFRGMMALTIGVFMAQPALLFMFNKEVTLQTSLDNEKRKLQKSNELNVLYKVPKDDLEQQTLQFRNILDTKYGEVAKARKDYIAETDGSGGTGKIGVKDIALVKKSEYEKLDKDYQILWGTFQSKINANEKELADIQNIIKKEEQIFNTYLNNGFLTRVEALNNLIKESSALKFRYYLLVIILILIDLMPIISKTLLPAGTYDEKVKLREEMEKEIAQHNISRQKYTRELYNLMAKANDEEAISTFFSITKEYKNEKIKAFSKTWRDESHETFKGLWSKMKREILSSQESW